MSKVQTKITKKMRSMVSRDKNRLVFQDFDFDLTYITSRIIAMGIPGDFIDKAWRNDAAALAEFF
eukprot:CAMPEP_0119146756 /NCGR_PEP_ID=MMETSP1310-20130426/39367_1 /TAXON_ID=464262 /ORGANISM="Genus nov. species nov., Strain RCC2339" /LENGTH=64 /DNA_ID=CAMNT_0007138669 /DNA_START=22 /DNA_END=216 /DNA_ORIENTATION=-